MKGSGLLEMTSSELQVRGGASPTLENIFTKVKNIVNFIADYVPKFVKGFVSGYSLNIF